ncbi:MAG: hypothetical protein AABZ53_01655, partial [Planctomycetota bacterium]
MFARPTSQINLRALVAAAGLAPALLSPLCHAQTLNWMNAAGGLASTPGNWNPVAIPDVGSPLSFALNATYPVTFNSAAAASRSMSFARGTTTLTMTSPHTTGTTIIGNTNALVASVVLAAGTWNTANFSLGSALGSDGELSVNGDTSVLDCGTFIVAANTDQICQASATNSGRIICGNVILGQTNTTGNGRLTINGQTSAHPLTRSTLSATGSITVAQNGTASFVVSEGGLATATGNLIIGERVSPGPILSSGIARVGGAGLSVPATLTVGGSARIGRGTLDSSDTGGGLLSVTDSGVVTIAGSTTVGGSGLGAGSLALEEGASLTTHGLSFGTSGQFLHQGGLVTVIAGPFTHDNPTLTVSGAPDTALVLDALTNTPTFAAPNTTANAILVGNSGTGTLTLKNGTAVSVTQGAVRMGNGAGSSGTINLESGAALTAAQLGQIVVGDAGSGTLNVRSGASIQSGGIFVSPGAGAGVLLVEGAGTNVAPAELTVNNSGVATVRAGASLAPTGPGTYQIMVEPAGSIVIDNATISAATNVFLQGTLTMTSGTFNADRIECFGSVNASGNLNAKVIGFGSTITATGPLSIGDGSTLGYSNSALVVGPHAVTLQDSDDAVLTSTSIAGGTLSTPDRFFLNLGSTLSGFGTISGPFANNGTITPTAAAGLTFGGVITDIGQGISGTKLTFANGGGFTGSGTISANIVGQAGSVITATGPLTMGNAASVSGFITSGQLLVDAHTVTIRDLDLSNLGTLVRLNGGTLTHSSSGFALTSQGLLQGVGTIQGSWTNAGEISPGQATGDSTGLLTINGQYAGNFPSSRHTLQLG